VKQSQDKIAYLPLMLFGLMAIRAISGFVSGLTMRWVSRRVVEDLRADAFKKLMTLPITFLMNSRLVSLLQSSLTTQSRCQPQQHVRH